MLEKLIALPHWFQRKLFYFNSPPFTWQKRCKHWISELEVHDLRVTSASSCETYRQLSLCVQTSAKKDIEKNFQVQSKEKQETFKDPMSFKMASSSMKDSAILNLGAHLEPCQTPIMDGGC